jgi:hypothetical protein
MVSELWFFLVHTQQGIAGHKSDLFLNFLRNLHNDFHSGCTNLYFCLQWIRVPGQYWLLFVFLMITIQIGVIQNLNVLIYIFQIAKDVWHFFSCIYWPFVLLHVKSVCFFLLHVYWLPFCCLHFWALMYSGC